MEQPRGLLRENRSSKEKGVAYSLVCGGLAIRYRYQPLLQRASNDLNHENN